MGIVTSLQALQQVTDPARSHWEVVLTSGKVITENKLVLDFRRGGYRQIDWALDLNSTGDLLKIKELRLICPDGQTARLEITEPGTAFQFKHKSIESSGFNCIEAQCIGRVTNKEDGTCECWIYDRFKGLIPYNSNVYNFGMWRDGLMPLTKLSQEVMGLRLG